MINAVFDGSTQGNLHLVTDPDTGQHTRSEDILCFEWMLSIGYLQPGLESSYRKELPGKMIMHTGFGNDGGKDGIPEIGENNVHNWNNLATRIEAGESVRIWYSYAPDPLCGFYCLCSLLRRYEKGTFYSVLAPDAAMGWKSWNFLHGWGELEPAQMNEYIKSQRWLTQQEIELYADSWDSLVNENSMLRACISGKPTSVNEDFYDQFIEKCLPSEPVMESEVIGDVMSEHSFGVGDCWYEYRIQKMIDIGKIRVLEDNERPMHRIIQAIR